MATLIASLNTTGFTRGANRIKRSVNDIVKNVSSAESAFSKLTRRIGRFGDSLGVNISVAAGFTELVDATVKLQKYETTMTSFTGSLASAREELSYVFDFANKMGVSFEGIATPFSKFAAAAEGFKKQEVHKVFEAFVTAASGLQLNMQEVNGVFLALQQIVSKGKLSMEELRLQLAERIPGAMRLAAKAANMSMQDFEAAVRAGTIDTREWMVDFAELVEAKFKSAADVARYRLQAAIMRLTNTFLIFKSEIITVAGSSENLVRLFDSVSKKIFQNERVVEALAGSFGMLSGKLADFIGNIDDDRISIFFESLSEIGNAAIEAAGKTLSKLFEVFSNPTTWEGIAETSVAVIDLGAAIADMGSRISALPGDIVDYGLAGYAIFGKFGPLRFLSLIEFAKKQVKKFNPDIDTTYQDSPLLATKILEAIFGSAAKAQDELDKNPIEVDAAVEVESKVTFHEGFEEELKRELEAKQDTVDQALKGFAESQKFIAGIGPNFGEMAKSAIQAWDDIKDKSLETSETMLSEQVNAANRVANVYKEALGTRGLSALTNFKSAIEKTFSALDMGALTDDMMTDLSRGLRSASEEGVKAFTKMGKEVNKVLADIVKKEKEIADDIKGYVNDITKIHEDASDRRFDIAQEGRTEAQQYAAIIQRTNSLFREANALSRQAQYQTGDQKKETLERSNELMEKALDYAADLESTEKNGVTAAKARKDQLTYINAYEKKSVENLKNLKKDAESQLGTWEKTREEFEKIDQALKDMVTAFTKGMKIDIDSNDAMTQLEDLQTMLDEMTGSDVFKNMASSVGDISENVTIIVDDWDDVTRQMEDMHSRATQSVLNDLTEIERAVEKAFKGAHAQYSVSVPPAGNYRYGGRIPGYGGGDGYNANTERGEYILPKESASYYDEDFLEAVRTRQYPKDREVTVSAPEPARNQRRQEEFVTFRLDLPVTGPAVELQATPNNLSSLRNQFEEMEKYAS